MSRDRSPAWRDCPACGKAFVRLTPVLGAFCSHWCGQAAPPIIRRKATQSGGRARWPYSIDPEQAKENPHYVIRTCPECQKEFARVRRSIATYCSSSCGVTATNRLRKGSNSYRSQYGPDNPNWKGGISKDHYRYKLRFAQKFPEKVRAHRAVQSAKRRGDLRPEPCEECGTTIRVHAHHHDYSKPLDVNWICQPCHNRHHHLGTKRK